jgi:DNA-binding transcriptional LysR family regulator
MELRHLRYFVAVAETLHFGRAAMRLGMAQPPLSQQIKALERDVGVLLFWRTKRRVALTAAGAALLVEARKILDQAELAVLAARRAERGESGQLIVGFVNSAVYGFFPSVLRQMRTRFPDVSLSLQDLTSEEQVEAMKANRLDVGLIRPPVSSAESLRMEVVWREPFVVALPRSHRLARQNRIAIEALAEESFLQVPRNLGPGFYDQFIHLCAAAGFAPKVVQEAHATQTIVSLIAGGMGIAVLPASMRNLRRAGVVYRSFKPPSPTTDLAVMWRADDRSPALRSFLEVLRKTAAAKPLGSEGGSSKDAR